MYKVCILRILPHLHVRGGSAYGPAKRTGGMDIKSVGVIGAGQMGNGIAHVFALSGYDVLMTDISREALDDGLELIQANLDRQLSREKITAEERDAAMQRIRTTMTLG